MWTYTSWNLFSSIYCYFCSILFSSYFQFTFIFVNLLLIYGHGVYLPVAITFVESIFCKFDWLEYCGWTFYFLYIFVESKNASNINSQSFRFFLLNIEYKLYFLDFFGNFWKELIFVEIGGWFDITSYCLNPYWMNSKL